MRTIDFIEKNTESYIREVGRELQIDPSLKILFHPYNQQAAEVHNQLESLGLLANSESYGLEPSADKKNENIKPVSHEELPNLKTECDLVLVFCDETLRVSSSLLQYLDYEEGKIFAPIISIHSSFHPLFLISVPKSGTHLLYNLAEELGYSPAVECPEQPLPMKWYCVQGTNSHTEAKDFLLESSKQHYFANRNHPFTHSPALFIYRHPLDVLVSEANYYHKQGNTVFSAYLSHLSFEQRIEKLANDPILLGSIRDRVNAFAAWLEFHNVIPISFEELVGSKGGGSDSAQYDLIWSLLLKLHISGNPEAIANKVFNTDSATFHKGQIGTYSEHLSPQLKSILEKLPNDYLNTFGYEFKKDNADGKLSFSDISSSRIEEFRQRPLVVEPAIFHDLPICAEHSYREHNIIKYKGKYFAVPLSQGSKDLSDMNATELSKLIQDERIQTVKRLITKKSNE